MGTVLRHLRHIVYYYQNTYALVKESKDENDWPARAASGLSITIAFMSVRLLDSGVSREVASSNNE